MICQLHEDVFPGESGSSLINLLKTEFKPLTVLSYSEARTLMYTDIYNINDSVECVYSGHRLYLDPRSRNPIGDLIQNNAPNGINCEHSFPQSKGAGNGNPRSDMHHLYPTRARVNEARLNFPFNEINDNRTERWFIDNREQGTLPMTKIDDYSEQIDGAFEPKESHKGNAARAIFYFYTMYRDVADAGFFSEQRKTLCEWHYLDKVDSLEWHRNLKIAAAQGDKRNPFILDCTLAERTYCPDIQGECGLTSNRNISLLYGPISLFPNPGDDFFHIQLQSYDGKATVAIFNNLGMIVYHDSLQIIQGTCQISARLPSGTYHMRLVLDDFYNSSEIIPFIVN